MAYKKSVDTRARLVGSMAQLLRTKGYAATGISDVISDSGVPKGSVYHHFPGGKQSLAAASVAASGEGIAAALGGLLDRAGHPIAAMAEFCNYYIGQLGESDFRRGCPLATVALEKAAQVDLIQQACGKSFEAMVTLYADHLVKAGARPAAAQSASLLVVSAIEGALVLCKAQRSTAPLAMVRDQLTDYLNSLLGEPRP
ncbi:MAG: TetR/AcrR family transcriptional regulator [Pseudomonadota bacterium]